MTNNPSCPTRQPYSLRAAVTALVTATALILPGGVVAQTATTSGHVFSANENGQSVSRIDLATGEVITQGLPIMAHNVQIAPDGRRLLLVGAAMDMTDGAGHGGTGHGSAPATDMDGPGELLILDPLDLQATPITVAVGHHPAHVVTDREGNRAFVTNSEDDTISVVDLAAAKVMATLPAGDYPHGLRASPDGSQLLVANVEGGTVSLIALHSLTEVAQIPVGKAPVQVAFLPDGSRAYVSLRDEDAVAVLDMATRAVVARIPVGRGPIQLYATPDGSKVYVANQGSETDPDNRVSVIDVASGTVVATVTTGMGAHGVVVSADGERAFVTNIADGTVSEIDTATDKVTATWQVGAGPNGVTFLP